jgi:hypothetical protein
MTKKFKHKLQPLDVEEMSILPQWYQKTYFGSLKGSVFGRRGVHGDGSCFFHAICAAQNTQNYLYVSPQKQQLIGHKFRCAFNSHVTQERWLKFLAHHKIKTKLTLEQLEKQFCKNSHWADEIMIKLVSDVLHLNLIFIDTQRGEIYCGVHGKDTDPMILILWVGHKHFEPIFRIKGPTLDNQTVATAQYVFSKKNNDNDVIDEVFHNYNMQCRDDE